MLSDTDQMMASKNGSIKDISVGIEVWTFAEKSYNPVARIFNEAVISKWFKSYNKQLWTNGKVTCENRS